MMRSFPLLLILAGCTACHEESAAGGTSNGPTSRPSGSAAVEQGAAESPASEMTKVKKTDEEWRQELTEEQYHVTREKGTERAFTGAYWNNHKDGTYRCVCCGEELFDAKTKFDSGTGWPSFSAPLGKDHVDRNVDLSLGEVRTEVVCHRCGAHLGHVFEDGPAPTGLRYCINSVALKFEERE